MRTLLGPKKRPLEVVAPVKRTFLTPATRKRTTVRKPPPKRRKFAKNRVLVDKATVIPGHEIERRIKDPGDLVWPRNRVAHTQRQIRLQVRKPAL
jgi:hypothetical protein